MKIIDLKISEIKPYEKNPRNNKSAIDAVANSIKEFGFKVPIVIDKNNVIVCGHTRYAAANKLKLQTVPCILADDLNDDQIKAFRLADNKTAELAEWDFELLDLELEDIFELDMSLFGFENIERDYNHIDELLEDGFGGVDGKIQSEIFTVSLYFPRDKELELKNLIKKEGKEYLSKIILKELD